MVLHSHSIAFGKMPETKNYCNVMEINITLWFIFKVRSDLNWVQFRPVYLVYFEWKKGKKKQSHRIILVIQFYLKCFFLYFFVCVYVVMRVTCFYVLLFLLCRPFATMQNGLKILKLVAIRHTQTERTDWLNRKKKCIKSYINTRVARYFT